ncbi:hypothetical protein BDV95DRAFT_166198 [Massariosphaeria phaeospora]|uniref:Uncharacterized protein n=1 Tax=Massariosphaeria phaeospora TaxID=100035 RepID=A0A7C8M4Z0_9PLEO|nr:hypothetical protein BDV95DRAFT_166198 [Massariosphaeria phaeospora]
MNTLHRHRHQPHAPRRPISSGAAPTEAAVVSAPQLQSAPGCTLALASPHGPRQKHTSASLLLFGPGASPRCSPATAHRLPSLPEIASGMACSAGVQSAPARRQTSCSSVQRSAQGRGPLTAARGPSRTPVLP